MKSRELPQKKILLKSSWGAQLSGRLRSQCHLWVVQSSHVLDIRTKKGSGNLLLRLTSRDLEEAPVMSQGNTLGWWTLRGSILSSRHWSAFVFVFFKGVKYTQNKPQTAGRKPVIRAEGHLSGSLTNRQKLMISWRGQGQKVLLHPIFTLMTFSCLCLMELQTDRDTFVI